MDFKQFRDLQQNYVTQLLKDASVLFTVEVDKDLLWETYLNSFPEGTNPIFRKKREFDCSCCRSFIKNFGNVVVVKDNKLQSIWGFPTESNMYQPVVDALDKMITSSYINGIFVNKLGEFGTNLSRELLESGQVNSWYHYFFKLPKQFIHTGNNTVGSVQGEHTTNRDVFERSLQQISIDSVETVLDLISQNSLYRGEEWKTVLEKFVSLKKEYSKIKQTDQNNWCWIKSYEVGPVVGRIKNHSIGTLLLDLTEGTDLDVALHKYEVVVAPTNYKRPQAIFTQKMIEQAKKTVEELGYVNALPRRFARLDDITVNDVLFADRNAMTKMSKGAFDALSKKVAMNPKSYDKVEEVSLERFVENVLPRAATLEALVENRHLPNFVSLIAPQDATAQSMFKWPNNFSWAYTGNIADSMKERVKSKGGKVDGVLRFSIQWNEDNDNKNDYDAHCIEPNGNHISFRSKYPYVHPSTGMLDVDIRYPDDKEIAVENITWSDPAKMQNGIYTLSLHCWAHRGGKSGFTAEIEYDGTIHQYEYRKNVPQGQEVVVAKLRFDRQNGIEIIESLPSSFTPKQVWGVSTQQFVPVHAVMYSPNYWAGNSVGNRHVIFALKECVNDTQPNGFFNEYLDERLMPHRKVFEALGREMKVEPSEEQLSGLGFATTKRNSLIVKVGGAVERIIRVMF